VPKTFVKFSTVFAGGALSDGRAGTRRSALGARSGARAAVSSVAPSSGVGGASGAAVGRRGANAGALSVGSTFVVEAATTGELGAVASPAAAGADDDSRAAGAVPRDDAVLSARSRRAARTGVFSGTAAERDGEELATIAAGVTCAASSAGECGDAGLGGRPVRGVGRGDPSRGRGLAAANNAGPLCRPRERGWEISGARGDSSSSGVFAGAGLAAG